MKEVILDYDDFKVIKENEKYTLIQDGQKSDLVLVAKKTYDVNSDIDTDSLLSGELDDKTRVIDFDISGEEVLDDRINYLYFKIV